MPMTSITESGLLPSKGLLYDGIGPEVTLRAMTLFEEKMRFAGGQWGKTMGTIVNACVTSPQGLDYSKLLLVDFEYLLYMLRVVSYGTEYHLALQCPNPQCRHEFTHVHDLGKAQVTYMDEGEVEYKEPYEIKLPKSGDVIGCRMLRAGDMEYIERRAKEIMRRNKDYQGSPEYILSLSQQLVTVNGKEIRGELKEQYMEKMHALDGQYMQHQLGKVSFGLDLVVETLCPKCFGEVEVGIPIDAGFFRAHFDE